MKRCSAGEKRKRQKQNGYFKHQSVAENPGGEGKKIWGSEEVGSEKVPLCPAFWGGTSQWGIKQFQSKYEPGGRELKI